MTDFQNDGANKFGLHWTFLEISTKFHISKTSNTRFASAVILDVQYNKWNLEKLMCVG